jgi:ribosomal protein S18 acetylase RimI-like enzyme
MAAGIEALNGEEKKMRMEPRPYRDEQDLERMKGLLVQGRKAGGPTYYVHVGDLDWWLGFLLQDQERRESIYVWEGWRADGGLSGWALFSPRLRAFDVYVHPEERGTEPAEQMWIWTEERMGEMVRERSGQDIRTMWVSERDGELGTLLERRGFVRSTYHLFYMTRSLERPVPEATPPPGFRVRHVSGEEEVKERAAVAHAAFGSGHPFELYRQRYLAFMRSPAYEPELDLVAVAPDGRFGAFCICWLDEVNRVGLFEPVGTHPEYRGKGLGKAVISEGLRRMQGRGMTEATVGVEYNNAAALGLYAAVGFEAVHRVYTYVRSV